MIVDGVEDSALSDATVSLREKAGAGPLSGRAHCLNRLLLGGWRERTVHAKGMFFQLNTANSSMQMREPRPGPVKNSLSNTAQWIFHAAYEAAARVTGPRRGTKSARPPIFDEADAIGGFSVLAMVNLCRHAQLGGASSGRSFFAYDLTQDATDESEWNGLPTGGPWNREEIYRRWKLGSLGVAHYMASAKEAPYWELSLGSIDREPQRF